MADACAFAWLQLADREDIALDDRGLGWLTWSPSTTSGTASTATAKRGDQVPQPGPEHPRIAAERLGMLEYPSDEIVGCVLERLTGAPRITGQLEGTAMAVLAGP